MEVMVAHRCECPKRHLRKWLMLPCEFHINNIRRCIHVHVYININLDFFPHLDKYMYIFNHVSTYT